MDEYPVEYLNSLDMPGLAPSHLPLKIGVPLMLLHNLDTGRGLCNETRCVFSRFPTMSYRLVFKIVFK